MTRAEALGASLGLFLLPACSGQIGNDLSPIGPQTRRLGRIRTLSSPGQPGMGPYSNEAIQNGLALLDGTGSKLIWFTLNGTAITVGSDYVSQTYGGIVPVSLGSGESVQIGSGVTIGRGSGASTSGNWTGGGNNFGSTSWSGSDTVSATAQYITDNGGPATFTLHPSGAGSGGGGGCGSHGCPQGPIKSSNMVKPMISGSCAWATLALVMSGWALADAMIAAGVELGLNPFVDSGFIAALLAYLAASGAYETDCTPPQ
ncbi:MAG: hypothetical protein ACYC8W_11685 [Candidatus Tyrphobacter sp.]